MRTTALALLLIVLPAAAAAEPIRLPEKRSERPMLKSVYSQVHQLDELKGDKTRAIVFVFMGLDCPVVQQYIPRLNQLHAEFNKQGVRIFGVYANPRVHVISMATHMHDRDISFPVFLDVQQRLANVLDAQTTPEVVVLDDKWEKRYQGAIDNQFTKRGNLNEASEHYLQDALTAIIDGKAVAKSYNSPSGCPIERLDPPPPNKDLTYYRDIAPLVQKHCQTCHREGGVAPFELLTYEDVYYSAARVQETVLERRMPPWHGFLNEKYGKLLNDKRLSEKEIKRISDWVRIGAPAGDEADAPPPIQWPDADAWEIGKPDFVYKIPAFTVPKSGILDYQFFRVPLHLKQDRWFSAVEVKPGNAEVVHHVGLHIVPTSDKVFTGFSGMAELYGLNTEGAILINDYVPGDSYNAKRYPPDQAVKIPAGSDLIFELHYTPNNREAVVDQSKVAFQWSKSRPQQEVLTKVFRRPIGRFYIPPHESHYRMEDSYYFRHDVMLDAVRPHFHLRAKSFRLEFVKRDENTEEIIEREALISVPVWDQDWQRTYELETPLLIPAGVELLATGIFDNSSLNPGNPDPSAEVQWGQQTNDEMFSTRFKFRVVKNPNSAKLQSK